MSNALIILFLFAYFFLLLFVSHFASRKSRGNEAFFIGNHQSKWYLVAFGMVGASISGVSFVSVPGMVGSSHFSYFQMVMGFFFGYLIVAYVLLPLYYRLNSVSIYNYLKLRFGNRAYKTGSSFFVVAKMVGAAAKLYVVALVLHQFLLVKLGIPFWVAVCGIVFLIWLYTFRGGIRSLVWTDCVQTLFLFVSLVAILSVVMDRLDMGITDVWKAVEGSPECRIFVFDDFHSTSHFLKQFFSGVFVVVVMTGLDQDMMQKNLSCRTLKESQQNMLSYGFLFLPVNFLLLVLGFLLLLLARREGIGLPINGDEILPLFASSYLGSTVMLLFLVGMVAASFSSADSALTSITTMVMMRSDRWAKSEIRRKTTHFFVCSVFCFFVLFFDFVRNKSVIDLIFTIVGYVYGPLLGMFSFGLLTKRLVRDRYVPFIAIFSPLFCFFLDFIGENYWNYSFGYELLMINGLITFALLFMFSTNTRQKNASKAF